MNFFCIAEASLAVADVIVLFDLSVAVPLKVTVRVMLMIVKRLRFIGVVTSSTLMSAIFEAARYKVKF